MASFSSYRSKGDTAIAFSGPSNSSRFSVATSVNQSVSEERLVVTPDSDRIEPIVPDISQVNIPADHRLRSTLPQDLGFYKFRETVKRVKHASFDIPPGLDLYTSCGRPTTLPDGWIRYVNPAGKPFFHDPEKNILTFTRLYEHEELDFILNCADVLAAARDAMAQHESQLVIQYSNVTPDADIEGDDGRRCFYYLASHAARKIWYPEVVEIDSKDTGIPGALEQDHQGVFMEQQYWMHFEFFANVQNPTQQDWTALLNMIMVLYASLITSISCRSSERLEDVKRMRDLVLHARESLPSYDNGNEFAGVLGRLMSHLIKDRFSNFHGQPAVRLSATDQIYDIRRERTHLFGYFLSPILLFSPEIKVRELYKVYLDKTVRKWAWRDFLDRQSSEWTKICAFGMILFAASLSFLTIQSVEENRTSRILCYVSTTSILGGVIVGFVLNHGLNLKGKRAVDGANFLSRQDDPVSGLESLAIVYSLPLSLIIWGFLIFLAAFIAMCFQPQTKVIFVLLSLTWSVMVLLIAWSLQVSMDQEGDSGKRSRASVSWAKRWRTWMRPSLDDHPAQGNIVSRVRDALVLAQGRFTQGLFKPIRLWFPRRAAQPEQAAEEIDLPQIGEIV